LSEQRKKAIAAARAVVVKVGTRVLTDNSGKLDRDRINRLAAQLARIAATGRQTILVSSGAVAAGVAKLGLTERPQLVSRLQAVAAIGQADLIKVYEQAFLPFGRHVAQVLLTAGDLKRRSGYLHVRNALRQIHQYGAVAIINENDSVSVAELQTTFGDNDRLAADVAGLLSDALLVILSDVDGLFDGPPGIPTSRVIDVVPRVDRSILSLAIDKVSGVSKGGMMSKLRAARLASSCGHHAIIGPGRDDGVLDKIIAGETIGTLFLPRHHSIRGRRRWIGSSAPVTGTLVVDGGAANALLRSGASLLAVGIRAVKGEFPRGAVVSIVGLDGVELARGLSNYPSDEVRAIRGMPSDEIPAVLGHCPYDSVVHRDNMAIVDEAKSE
jgi:glutamate 5-kinase